MRRIKLFAGVIALGVAGSSSAQPTVDPLTVKVDDTAAQRFTALWKATGGKPSAAHIQSQYLAAGGRGIEVFTPGRIISAERMAARIAESPDVYAAAVGRCLPWIAPTNAQLRSTYLGLKGLLPNRALPHIAVVVGRNNSGGTAAPGIQVIGLEVICRLSPDRAAFEERMRQFYAHETVHTWQAQRDRSADTDPLLSAAISEGVPDHVTALVTARIPNPERDLWARPREAELWRQFQSDTAIVRAGSVANASKDAQARAEAAFKRWFANAGNAPAGWPDELGYWIGMRIADAYVARAADPHAALDDLIDAADPAAILKASEYRGGR